ncbi:N-ethylmaleimide reductase [Vibrio thalassae]|uniref:N-ethylmaleimide reductase n=1 Tax=Vibrio thalassae TaxID=1243014 RepID=A0A240EL08_9VIBR|nr:N-ethylmaleimide reductase [Vibrio thalassae]
MSNGITDMVGFGRPFIANPDLPNRQKHGYPLAERNPNTLFGGNEVGLLDYPEYHAQSFSVVLKPKALISALRFLLL